MNENPSFGYWVRRRRKSLDLTQTELGRLVGASAAMIRKIEADERRPSRELAVLLADALTVPTVDRERFLRAARSVAAVDELPLAIEPEPPSPVVPVPPSNLPAPMTSMVNRVRDLAAVSALLRRRDVRLVTLVGPPGMGKTRLSAQVAEQLLPEFRDGVWFVDLSPVTAAEQMLTRIAMTLDLPMAHGLPLSEFLRAELRDRQLLLVLDNLEQFIDQAALEVSALLRASPRLKILATSRVRLDIYGEHEYLLPPMSVPPPTIEPGIDLRRYEAVQLFVDRARQHQPDFDLNEQTAEPVVEICRRMDGLPLALELAAARTRRMQVEDLAVALREASGRDWHSLLHVTARDLPLRQQTLFDAIAWSYSLLAAEERAIFRRLGVFAGDFDAPAAAAVCLSVETGVDFAIRAALERLVDHNLVSLVAREPDRWRLLEMIREFAVAEMDGGEYQSARGVHARHFAARQSDWYAHWLDPAYLDAVEDDLDNFRAALHFAIESADSSLAHDLGAVMGRFWERRGLLREGRQVLSEVLALPGAVDPKARFSVLHEATILAWMQHDFAAAETLAAESMALARGGDMPGAVTVVLNLLGRIYLEQARYDEAERVLVESTEIGRNLPGAGKPGMQTVQRGEVALAQGDLERAETLTRAGLEMVTEKELVPYCLGWNNLAETALARGDLATAREALCRVLPLAHLHSRRTRIFLIAVAGLVLGESLNTTHDTTRDMWFAAASLAYVSAANTRMGDPLSPMTQSQLAARIAATRQRLSSEQWSAAWREGARLKIDQAIMEARRVLEDNISAG